MFDYRDAGGKRLRRRCPKRDGVQLASPGPRVVREEYVYEPSKLKAPRCIDAGSRHDGMHARNA